MQAAFLFIKWQRDVKAAKSCGLLTLPCFLTSISPLCLFTVLLPIYSKVRMHFNVRANNCDASSTFHSFVCLLSVYLED